MASAPEPLDSPARAAIAAEIRRMHHAMVGHEHDPALLADLTRQLAGINDRLEAGTPRSREPWTGRHEKDIPPDGTPFVLDADRPVSGSANPWSIPTPIIRRGDRAEKVVRFDSGYEGAPGRAHGGIIAALYDDLCGYNLVLEATLAFTGWLRIDYRAPTPLHTELTFATWVEWREGRKMKIVGECTDGDTVISTCDSIFITVEPETS